MEPNLRCGRCTGFEKNYNYVREKTIGQAVGRGRGRGGHEQRPQRITKQKKGESCCGSWQTARFFTNCCSFVEGPLKRVFRIPWFVEHQVKSRTLQDDFLDLQGWSFLWVKGFVLFQNLHSHPFLPLSPLDRTVQAEPLTQEITSALYIWFTSKWEAPVIQLDSRTAKVTATHERKWPSEQ